MVEYIRTRVDGHLALPLRNAVREHHDRYVMAVITESPFYLLGSIDARSDALDITGAREAGIPVIRTRYGNASEHSILAIAPPSIFVMCEAPEPEDLREQTLTAIRDAVQNLGIHAVFDQSSRQENDLVHRGQKFVGAADNHPGPDDPVIVTSVLSMAIDYGLFDRIDLPTDKFKGKESETMRERVTGLHEVDPSLAPTDVVSELERTIPKRLPFDTLEESSVSAERMDAAEQRYGAMSADASLFKH